MGIITLAGIDIDMWEGGEARRCCSCMAPAGFAPAPFLGLSAGIGGSSRRRIPASGHRCRTGSTGPRTSRIFISELLDRLGIGPSRPDRLFVRRLDRRRTGQHAAGTIAQTGLVAPVGVKTRQSRETLDIPDMFALPAATSRDDAVSRARTSSAPIRRK